MIHSLEVPGPVRELAARLAEPQPMRRGSLSERYVKCSKPGCGCAANPKARHGPYYSLTRTVGGQTQSRFLTVEEADLVRQQVDTGKQFRRQVEAYWAACEQWADAQLEAREEEGEREVKKTTLGEALAHDLGDEIDRLLGREAAASIDFEAVETAARRQALRFAARVVEQRLNADRSGFTGASEPCACGQQARYVDRRAKSFQRALGELRLERAYYYCAACGGGFCPRDQPFGMEGGSLSPAVRRMIGSVGAAVSFQEGSELLRELAGWRWEPSRWSVGRSSWERKSPRMKGSRGRLGGKGPCLPPSISDWMARGFPCGGRNCRGARVSRRMVPLKPGR